MTNVHVEEARWRVLDALPFFSRIVLRMPRVATRKVPLAAVDRHARLYYHPERFADLGPDEAAGVVLHEVLHLVLKHFARAEAVGVGPESAERWNAAADLEVNPLVRRTFRLPPGVLFPEALGLSEGDLAEGYYAALAKGGALSQGGSGPAGPSPDEGGLPEEADPSPLADPSGSAADGQARPWELPADDPQHPGLLEPLVDALVEDAAREYQNRYASSYGPFSHQALVAWAERVLAPPQVDWRARLRRWVRDQAGRAAGADDYTFHRVRRRGRLLLPRTEAKEPRLALVIDTSASMGQEDFDRVLAEVRGILRAAGDVRYFAVDTAVTAEGPLRSLQGLELRGGGATDMGAGIRAAVEEGYRSIVVLTDGGTDWPQGPERGERVMAVQTQDYYGKPPKWIEAVELDQDERRA